MKNVHLLLIDPQNDFCDIPASALPVDPNSIGATPQPIVRPALPVPGAHADMERLANFIDRAGGAMREIHVTLDTHNPIDIAHPAWWQDNQGNAPAPFTVIRAAEVRDGMWRARDPNQQAHSVNYVNALEAHNKYLLVIWPEHVLLGSWGHNVHAAVKDALDRWARRAMKLVNFVIKGTNPTTEHYSAIRAEVPDPNDPSTELNERLIASLRQADDIIIAGEALSHCVANTVRDLADAVGPDGTKKLILLTDCASSVGGFEQLGRDFVAEMTARGMRTSLSTDLKL